jgi:hypothetical protein
VLVVDRAGDVPPRRDDQPLDNRRLCADWLSNHRRVPVMDRTLGIGEAEVRLGVLAHNRQHRLLRVGELPLESCGPIGVADQARRVRRAHVRPDPPMARRGQGRREPPLPGPPLSPPRSVRCGLPLSDGQRALAKLADEPGQLVVQLVEVDGRPIGRRENVVGRVPVNSAGPEIAVRRDLVASLFTAAPTPIAKIRVAVLRAGGRVKISRAGGAVKEGAERAADRRAGNFGVGDARTRSCRERDNRHACPSAAQRVHRSIGRGSNMGGVSRIDGRRLVQHERYL